MEDVMDVIIDGEIGGYNIIGVNKIMLGNLEYDFIVR